MHDRSVALDVSTLDDALLSLLLSPESIKSVFKYTKFSHLAYNYFPNPTGDTGDDDEEDEGYHVQRLTLYIFRGVVLLFTLGGNIGFTPAMAIFQSKIIISKNNGSPDRRHIYKLLLLSSGAPALYHAMKLYALSYSSLNDSVHGVDLSQRESLQTIARQRRIKIISYALGLVDKVVPPAVLLQYLRCIFQRKKSSLPFVPSSLAMNLCGLTFVPVSRFINRNNTSQTMSVLQRNVNFMYAYRRLLFQELMLLFKSIVPSEGFKNIIEDLKRRWRL